MTRKLLLLAVLLFITSGQSQEAPIAFSDALHNNLKAYNKASNAAYENKDFAEGQRLFDSLVRYKLVGTQFDDFTLKGYQSKKVQLNQFKKPVFIVTYASWCVINKGDIPALNQLANEHRSDLQVIVLFWDEKSALKKIAPQFNDAIKICYANESYDNDSHIIATLKHTLGFPTSYFMDENKKIVSIKRISNDYQPKMPSEKALSISYAQFNGVINESLLSKNIATSTLATF
ncbi:TlpA family protein disulfide reductase [Flavobacterium restrictum]|uniref:Redoxin domain-containing protein n=1 Tax=Flavobacterium restrictum TaxID=2594428 RepID=A0A553E2S4_9FLAO|nr:redoxin domain-containing protein [Flavobacterium restrictum]TRX39280.1 redoxin domain-containing protein [Flavobacterium restrictum]